LKTSEEVPEEVKTPDEVPEEKLYDLCGVNQVTSKDKEIFMLVEKDYPLRKGLVIVMICYKLQVENYSHMVNDLILKKYKITNCPSQQGEVPTASEESSQCQKKKEATAVKIALLLKEDLNRLWALLKESLRNRKPTSDKEMELWVEQKDAQDVIWRSQQTEHGQALVKSWKLLTSCGVHIITFTTTMFVLLVEKKYPLSRFTLEQLVNVARLQVEEESEMSLELLRFTRQQLLEYQQE
nr:hypothetical protein [Tanacetum cinerariifolium]